MNAVRRMIAYPVAILMAAMLAACGSGHGSGVSVTVIGDPADPFDEERALSPARELLRAATTEGLVAFDEQGRVIPALADRWIVTEDGLSYIFRLRDGTWRDGEALTAASAREALRRAIRAQRGSALGLDLAGIEEIRAMAGRVIEIRLSRPMPYLLQLLAQPELGLAVDGEGAGPMQFAQVQDLAILEPIPPGALGLPEIPKWDERVRAIRLSAMPAARAVERFNEGETDLVLNGTIADFPLSSSVGILRGTIQIDPVAGLFGLAFVEDAGFLASPENREAIALAIDREALIVPFGVSGWVPTTRIVPPGLDAETGDAAERWADMTIENRQALARARVDFWLQGEEDPEPLKLRISLPAGPGADLLFERIAADLSAIGIEAEQVGLGDDADLRLIDAVARYPRPRWFLNRLSCAAQRICSEAADDLVTESGTMSNSAVRAAVLREAERELTDANLFIPFGSPIRWSLVRGDAIGFATNQWGWHPLMPMALLPR